LAKRKLNPDGILAFCLPGSLTYLSQDLGDLNACILNGLKNAYHYVRIIPGDYNLFLASDSKNILEVDSRLIIQRIKQRNIKTDILIPAYLDYRLNQRWVAWFTQSLVGATRKINQDFLAFAVFEMLVLWNKQFSPLITQVLGVLKNINLTGILLFILFITLILLYFFSRKKHVLRRLSVAYSIATTGFFGMLANLILIFSFQVVYGYLYHRIGILISVFMAGIAAGSILMTRNFIRIKNALGLFIKLEVLILIFSLGLGLILPELARHINYVSLIFISLFFICGLMMGLEFPLASKIYLIDKGEIGESVGLLYAADLIGGGVAGILGGIIFLPILGLLKSCLVMVMLKLSSFSLLIATKKEFNENLLTKRVI
jgi:spermidine synthase